MLPGLPDGAACPASARRGQLSWPLQKEGEAQLRFPPATAS